MKSEATLIELVSGERTITQWDVLPGYEKYYPTPSVTEEAGKTAVNEGKRNDLWRYTLETPIKYQILPIASDDDNDPDRYQFVTQDPIDRRGWLQVMGELIHDKKNDVLIGMDNYYMVTIGVSAEDSYQLEYTFFYRKRGGELIMIGHVRV